MAPATPAVALIVLSAASSTGNNALSTVIIGAIALIGTCLALWFLSGGGGRDRGD